MLFRSASLPGFEELFGPRVIQTLCNAFTAAELGDTLLTLQAIQYDPDLLFG